jgi:hypothetical protein
VVLITGSGGDYLVRMSTTPAATDSETLTGFDTVTGIDKDSSGNIYVVGTGGDVAGMALTGWFRASYSASPWTGTASAGTSGGRTVTSATAPAVGAAVNGKFPANFDGVNDYLSEPTLAMSSYHSAAAYTTVVLVNPSGAAAPSGTIYQDDLIVGSSGDLGGIAYSTSGVAAYHYDGVSWKTTAWTALAAGWNMVSVTFSAGTISMRVNQGAAVTVAAGNAASLGVAALIFGRTNAGFSYTAQNLLEVITADTALSSGDLDIIKSYFNTTYGLTL